MFTAIGIVARYTVLTSQGRHLVETGATGLKLGRIGKLGIEGLSGDVWHDFHIARLTIADEKGVWIEARDVGVVWDFAPLLRRRMHAEKITAGQVTVLRRPTLTPKTKSSGLPISFDIDSVKVLIETCPAFSVQRGLFDLASNFRIERKGGGEGVVRATSRLHTGDGLAADFLYGRGRPFRVNADVTEAQGGAFAGSLGLPVQRFSLSVQAFGETKAGKVRMIARSGAETPLDVDGSWNGRTGGGTARINLGASTLLTRLVTRFGPQAVIKVSASPSATQGLHDTHLDFRSDNLVLFAAGPVGFVDRSFPQGLAVNAWVADLSRMAPAPKMGAGRFTGRLTGSLSDINLKGQVSADDFSLGGYRLAHAAGPVSVRFSKHELTVTANAVGKGGSGASLLAGLMGAAPRADITLSRLADGRLLIRSLNAKGYAATAMATGSNTLLGGLKFDGDLTVSNLAAVRHGASGQLTARWSAARGRDRPWAFTADARGAKFATGMGELDRLLGPAPRLQAKASYKDHGWTFTDARLDGAAGNANAAGVYGPQGALKFNLAWDAKGPFQAGPVEIGGKVKGGGALTGTLSNPRADLTAVIDGIDIAKLKVGPANLVLTFVKAPDGSNGEVRLTGASNYGPAHAGAKFRFADGGIDLSDIDANAGGVAATGALALRKGQPSHADLILALGQGAFLVAGRADARIKVVDAPGGPVANMHVTGANLSWGQSLLRSIDLTANGPIDRLPYRVKAEARLAGRPISVDGSGVAANAAQGYSLSFEGDGKVNRTPMRTITPLIVNFGGPDLSAQAALSIGGGRADIDARQRDQTINVKAVLAGVDISALAEDMAGKIDATLTATGKGSDLAADINATLAGARSRDGPKNAAIDGTFKASLRGDRLAVDATASNIAGLHSTANFVLPAEASAAPFRIAINRKKPLEGRFDVDGELRPVWDLFFGGSRTLGGHLTAQGTIAGTLADPRLSGQATLANGMFEDFSTGLKLRNVGIGAGLNTDAITVAKFTGEDGHGGTLTGDGRISLERAGASTLALNAQRFLLIDNDLAKAEASGAVTVVRDADGKARLTGKLTIDRADVVADPPTPSGVVPMDVREINVPSSRVDQLAAPKGRGPSVALDVTLKAPRRIFVKGRGLDAELSLDAHVGGTTAAPVLDGVARIVRGDYDFANKRFEFDESGVVYLASSPDRIRLDLSATREDPSLTAVVRIAGTAAKPQITLTSTPPLPNDEVLSQVLFGRSASQLSPLEAAQLAAALTSLATGGGFDVIGGLKAFAGLDRLSLAGGDATGVSVSGGKYITDDVYLELTGGGREAPSAQVEWRVRRSLSIVSRLAGDGDTRLSVRWRKDSKKSATAVK